MDFYGVAIAVTGRSERFVDVTFTTIVMRPETAPDFSIVEERSFTQKVDLDRSKSIFAGVKKITDHLGSVVGMQMRSLEDADIPFRPVAVEIGKDARKDFDVDTLFGILFKREIADKANSINELAELLGGLPRKRNAAPTNHDHFVKGLSRTERLELQKTYSKLSVAMDYCYLRKGNFVAADTTYLPNFSQYMEAGKDEFNNQLIELKQRLDSGDQSALFELTEIANEHGKDFAELHRSSNIFRTTSPWPDYASRPDLQEKYPRFSYIHWHPDIESAFNNGVREILGVSNNMNIKFASKPRQPFFTDPVALMVKDQIDVAMGHKREDEISGKDRPEWRQKIANASAELSGLKR